MIDLTSKAIDKDTETVRSTIIYVNEKTRHDKRYAIHITKAKT